MNSQADVDEAKQVRSALEAIVSAMRDEARLDSSGVFTIDSSRAVDKLRRFQVERPQDFVLWLGAAAVAGGATEFLVTIGIDQICVEFDGQIFQPDELQQVLEESGSSQPGRVGHLAFALTAALGTQPQEIIVESGCQRLQVTPGTTRVWRLLNGSAERVRFLIIRQQANGSQWEYEKFNYLCDRIPQKLLKICVNRRQDLGFRLPADLVHGQHYWRGTDQSPLMERLVSNVTVREHAHSGNFSVLLALDSWHRESPGQIAFLYDGLLIPVEVPCPFCFRAVVSWPGIGLNLSRTSIIESQEQQEVLAQVTELAQQVAGQFILDYAELKPGFRHLAQPWLASVAASESSLAEDCRSLLNVYHTQGTWLERDDPGRLVKELLQSFIEPSAAPARRSSTPPPMGFWASLAAMFNPAPFAPQQGQVQALREDMNERKKWRNLVAALLSVFDPASSLRLGLSAPVAEPDWLVLEGLLPDGTHLLLRAEEGGVTIRCFYSKNWPVRASNSELQVPDGWQAEVVDDSVVFRGGGWREPEALLSLLHCVLDSRRRAQSQELLECPGCASSMQKLVLDIVLDRCFQCRTLWLDYAELEWLLKVRPDFTFQAPPEGGNCPRCRQPLQPQLRANRPGAECKRCRGFWISSGQSL
ncbi:zf-TFIIB domain-containing protein [bacterium]|nr:zf-TFIIB domain-containing protein [bacterium]